MDPSRIDVQDPKPESFRAPASPGFTPGAGAAALIDASSIVAVTPHTFTFRENQNTPGRTLEQSVAISVPPGAGFFTCLSALNGAFTTADFGHLTERPLGQFFVSVGLRGNNFVCTVRLTDSNSDDPVFISVSAIVVFFK